MAFTKAATARWAFVTRIIVMEGGNPSTSGSAKHRVVRIRDRVSSRTSDPTTVRDSGPAKSGSSKDRN